MCKQSVVRSTLLHTAVLCLTALGCSLQATTAWGAEAIMHTRSYNAFTVLFGRPEFFAGSMHKKGSSEARVTLNLVSFAEIESSQSDGIELDGETYQAVFSYSHNLTDRLEVTAQLPYMYHSGGFMDSTVDEFHNLFGLPEGNRPNQGQDELLFAVQETGREPFRFDDSAGGIGDTRTNVRYLLSAPDPNARQLALQGGIKFASGDEDDLLGSGATDYSIGFGYSDPLTLSRLRMTLSAHAGVLFMGDGEVLSDQQEDTVGFGGLQLSVAATQWLSLIAQIQGATAYYESNLDTIGSTTVQLGFGANFQFPQSGWNWQIGIVEDGLSDVMPDFALHMEISRRFGGG